MPPKKKKLKVIKVPQDYQWEYKMAQFPYMPILYLEYFENRNKVIPQLRGTEYIPRGIDISGYRSIRDVTSNAEQELIKEVNDSEFTMTSTSFRGRSPDTSKSEHEPTSSARSAARSENRNFVSIESLQGKEDVSDTIDLKDSSSSDKPHPSSEENDPVVAMLRGAQEKKTSISEPGAIASTIAGATVLASGGVSSAPHQYHTLPGMPPTFSQINSGKIPMSGGMRDLSGNLKDEEAILTKKRDILWKLKLLKRGYKDAIIPDFNEYTELATLEREYDQLVRQLRIDSKVSNYKRYLTMGFQAMEFILTKMVNLDAASGLTESQLTEMNEYERLLVEIGEKSSLDTASQWSPEIRLGFLVLMNTVIFVGGKMAFQAGGTSILDSISNKQGGGGGGNEFASMMKGMMGGMMGGGMGGGMGGMGGSMGGMNPNMMGGGMNPNMMGGGMNPNMMGRGMNPNMMGGGMNPNMQSKPKNNKSKMKGPDLLDIDEITDNKKNA